jgi:hypothetical protein
MCTSWDKPGTAGAFDRLFAGNRKTNSIKTDQASVFQYRSRFFMEDQRIKNLKKILKLHIDKNKPF